jgi:hypothetical protein
MSVARTEHMTFKLTSRVAFNTAEGVVCTSGMER